MAHVCIWPIRLQTLDGSFSAFHPIDWGARRDFPGGGLQVLRSCYIGNDVALCVGGSEMTRKILPAVGFKPQNTVTFLERPLHPLQPAWAESPRDWKLPARIARNIAWHYARRFTLPRNWTLAPRHPRQISSSLWPQASISAKQAVSFRSAQLLEHIAACPEISKTAFFVLLRGQTEVAYFFLAQVRNQVRLADYGPVGLGDEESHVLGIAAQTAARSSFPDAVSLLAVTSEEQVRAAWVRAGLRTRAEEPIKALKMNKQLNSVTHFRLTLLDWDSLCL